MRVNRESFRGDCSVYTWLAHIATNLVRDHQRSRKFQFWRRVHRTAPDLSELSSLLPSPHSSAESQMLARERAQQVSAVLETLSVNQRTIFLMRFIEEMELQEICQATGMQTQYGQDPSAPRSQSGQAEAGRSLMENHRDNHLTHLTDEQFTDLLLGTSPAAVTAHLSACPQCAQEAQRVSGAIGSFAQQSRLWAERRAAAAPPLHARDWQPAFPWLHIPTSPQAWAASGSPVALALGIGISLRGITAPGAAAASRSNGAARHYSLFRHAEGGQCAADRHQWRVARGCVHHHRHVRFGRNLARGSGQVAEEDL